MRCAGFLLLLGAAILGSAPALRAQSGLERPPVMGGVWTGRPGTLHFDFEHHFRVTPAPARKVINTPTLLFAASVPWNTLVGARYATSSDVFPGVPNEWEFFARHRLLWVERGQPLDAAIHAGWNQAARSLDAEGTIARAWGRLRLLAAGRVLGDAYGADRTRGAAVGAAVVRLQRYISAGAEVASLLDREAGEKIAWSAGLTLAIPYTPHTIALHLSNVTTETLQGSSRGSRYTYYGFIFTVPVTLARYFGGPASEGGRVIAPAGRAGAGAAGAGVVPEAGAASARAIVVSMTDQLRFVPGTVRIAVGDTVRWVNGSSMLHTVTADPTLAQKPADVELPPGAGPFNSGYLKPGDVFEQVLTVPGRYRYFCIPHEIAGMLGVIIVEARQGGGS